MKTKNLTVILLAALIITACAPAVAAEPTEVTENNTAPEIISDVEDNDPEKEKDSNILPEEREGETNQRSPVKGKD